MDIKNEIAFLKKIRREYLNQPNSYPKNVVNDLIDLGVHDNLGKTEDYDRHFINQIDNQINLLKSQLKKNAN